MVFSKKIAKMLEDPNSFRAEFLAMPEGPAREKLVYEEAIRRGPPKNMVPVTKSFPDGTSITYQVMPDVLSIDGLRVAMTAQTAQRIANAFGLNLPTSTQSKQIWEAAKVKARAAPLSGSGYTHDGKHFSAQDVVSTQIGASSANNEYSKKTDEELRKHNITPDTLVAGHGKDIIQPLSNSDTMSIGGWQGTDNKALQPYSSPHGASTQSEYGTWARLVGPTVTVTKGGVTRTIPIAEALADKDLYKLLSEQKGLKQYNTQDKNKTPIVLKQKDTSTVTPIATPAVPEYTPPPAKPGYSMLLDRVSKFFTDMSSKLNF